MRKRIKRRDFSRLFTIYNKISFNIYHKTIRLSKNLINDKYFSIMKIINEKIFKNHINFLIYFKMKINYLLLIEHEFISTISILIIIDNKNDY